MSIIIYVSKSQGIIGKIKNAEIFIISKKFGGVLSDCVKIYEKTYQNDVGFRELFKKFG